MRGILLLLGALLAFGVRASTPASTASPIEAFSTGLVSLQGEFAQQVYDANDRLREESRGTVALAVPRQFRWDYQQPFEQTIVADGSRIWIYDPDLVAHPPPFIPAEAKVRSWHNLGATVEEIDCMSGCARPSTVAFRAEGKTAYLFGDVGMTDLPDLVTFVRLYLASADGSFADARPLGALREKAIARIPGRGVAIDRPPGANTA